MTNYVRGRKKIDEIDIIPTDKLFCSRCNKPKEYPEALHCNECNLVFREQILRQEGVGFE